MAREAQDGAQQGSQAPALAVELIDPRDPARFDSIVAIYEDVLPASERKTPAELEQMLAMPDYRFFAAVLGISVIGFAIVRRLGAGADLLEYMGVRRDCWDRGLGGRMFKGVAAHPDLAGETMLLEVEDDTGFAYDHERSRRKRFYRRAGCLQVEGLAYEMPKINDDDPPAMNILIHAADRPHALAKADLARWLSAIYVQVYKRKADDPAIDRMLAPLPDLIPLISPPP
jgi:GNAT superfamily N-acetyltransferase